MNEQRQQAYLNLIESLRNSPSGEEPEILEANQDLLDADFLQMLDAVAETALQKGEENAANWLRNIAIQLRQVLMSSQTVANTSQDFQDYLQFLMAVLQVTAESDGDAQVVYPILAANTEKLKIILADVLQRWAMTALPEMQPDEAQDFAANIFIFSNRIQQFPLGDKASNMEIAIAGYEVVLTAFIRSAFPQRWAGTQNNLGNAYCNRIVGEKAENIELAISAYNAALEVRTKRASPQQWAGTQNNLGLAYSDRIVGEKAENIELAIAAYNAALEVTTKSAFPQDWATTQNNLGTAYRNRIVGEKAENLERAIAAYNAALEVYTKSAFPQDWAMTQNNLGTAYSDRIVGETAENLERAIVAFNAALEVRTKSAFPQDNAQTLFNLGILYQKAQQFTEAYTTLKSAIETVEFLRGEIVSGDEIKRKQAEEWNKLYRRMVEVCLELRKDTEAIEYTERSKTRNLVELLSRNLVELLFSHDSYPKVGVSEEHKNQLQQIQQKIEQEKRRLEQAEKLNSQDINRYQLNLLRQEREKLITRITGLYPIRFSEIQNLLDKETAIIQWYIFARCFRTFIITRDREQPEIWQSEPQDLKKLKTWRNEYLQLYFEDKPRWRYCLNDRLSELAEILHIQEILSLVPSQCKKAILIPHRYLHLLPLHALPFKQEKEAGFSPKKPNFLSEEYLIDKFPEGVSYSPSCQLLSFAHNKATTLPSPEFRHFFAIQNPTDNLEFTDIEVETIAAAFQPSHILSKSEATALALTQPPTKDYFYNAHWLHFSCHGYFNFNSPEKSALQLASTLSPLPANAESSRYVRVSDDEEIELESLTLEDIFQLNFPHCRLVTLSACETGLVDINSSDEYIGLPSGFIRAGAASIVSSLWAIDDFATALLMIKFYENLQTLTPNVPLALNKAQQWFRQVTQKDLRQWLDSKIHMDAQQKQKIKQRLQDNYKPEQQPFKEPCFWAAFCAVGK